jgi:uncharacterized iron-regulated protein
MIRFLLFALTLTGFSVALGQQHGAYLIYNKKGKKVSYEKMLKELAAADIVLFGELHDNPIAHWMQLKVTKDLHKRRSIVLGAEMIESDDQQHLDAYLAGKIDQKAFDTLARLWINHKTDYKPLVDFAKSENLKFVAANVPRRYASKVYKGGWEVLNELPENEKQWIAPLPIPYDANLSQYQEMLKMMGGHASETFPMAQAIKDATMAHFILKNLGPDQLFIHYNGSFHSNYYEGINWYINQYQPGKKIKTINTVLMEDISKPDKDIFKSADFILVVDHEMTSTY